MIEYPQEFKDHITKLMFSCLKIIGHSEYQLRMIWKTEEDPASTPKNTTKATIYVNHVYLYCTLSIFPDTLCHWIDKEWLTLAEIIMHEACHLYLEPVAYIFMWDVSQSHKENAINSIERQTQRICNSIIRSCNDTWYLPENL